jgi:hypothetical protein
MEHEGNVSGAERASRAGARGKSKRLTHWGTLLTWPTAPGRVDFTDTTYRASPARGWWARARLDD